MSSVVRILQYEDAYKDTNVNTWSWEWLKKHKEHGEGDVECYRQHIRKVEQDSTAWCVVCACTINYGNRGLTAVTDHMGTKKHTKARKAVENGTTMPGKSILNVLKFRLLHCILKNKF